MVRRNPSAVKLLSADLTSRCPSRITEIFGRFLRLTKGVRRSRIHIAGMPLHIVQRGHNRSACFFAEEDYLCYLHWLAKALKETDCALRAHVLMTNHVHRLITPTRAESVSRFIMALGRRYVRYINKTQGRTGTLWGSRYKSSLIDADDYLLSCQRYIEMNPVRAGMVDDPAHYR
jgi:putative transposase